MTDDGAFARLLEYVEDELNFATSHYNDSYLDRRISSRMRRSGVDTYDEYLTLLQSDPDEHEALLDSLSINVTGFFRNPDVWSGIRQILRQLADSAGPSGIRIWSAACADGREAYSLSMLAHDDPKIDADTVTIVGTDISEPALETARSGIYPESRTVDIGEQLEFLRNHSRYVEHTDNTYQITDAIKRNVRFERHDLINGQPKSGFDLVVCRNLFIYIDGEYKASMLETIAESLRPTGYLVIGKAETIPPDLKSGFTVLNGRLRIYQRESVEQPA